MCVKNISVKNNPPSQRVDPAVLLTDSEQGTNSSNK